MLSISRRQIHTRQRLAIKVLSFDAMDTLIRLRESPATVYSRQAEKMGLQVDESLVKSAFPSAFSRLAHEFPGFGHSSVGAERWWAHLIHAVVQAGAKSPPSKAKLESLSKFLYEYYKDPQHWKPCDEKIPEVLEKLRARKIPLAIISNFDGRLRDLLKSLKMADYFEYIALSGELGHDKPDPRIFQTVIDHFKLATPAELLHIGDHPRKDYEAARNFGAHALLYDPKQTTDDDKNRISDFESIFEFLPVNA
ncbi:unnamed protein product, partial [Mesorhabditis spiculigera]